MTSSENNQPPTSGSKRYSHPVDSADPVDIISGSTSHNKQAVDAMTFASLLELCPPELRDNIRYFATDSTGHRSGFFAKPVARDGHWHTDQPYCLVGMDPAGAKDWTGSLIKR